MRFFIALEIPEESKEEVKRVQQKIKQLIPSLSLTYPEKLHLTIAFVGEQPEEFKSKLIEVMNKSSQEIPPFTITPSYLDGFPHFHSAHILWIGVNGEIDELYQLRHRIKDGLEGLNLTVDERRFVPHIAIGKINALHINAQLEEQLNQVMKQGFSPITVSSVKLFESIPNHGLHSHNTLAEIKLI